MSMQSVWDNPECPSLPALTPEEESRYLQAYLPLVRKITRQLAAQCSSIIDRQDMEQTALMGLLYAIRRYGAPDESFGGYAAQRIRGAVLDELRRLDWRPRSLRQKCHRIKDVMRDLHQHLGREPEPEERQAAGVSSDDYDDFLLLENAAAIASLDELLADNTHDIPISGRNLEEQYITQKMLSEALALLTEKESLILSLYYQHDMNLKEIALTLGVSEARVCQINKKISEKINHHFQQFS